MNHRKLVFIPSRLHAGRLRLLRGQRCLHAGARLTAGYHSPTAHTAESSGQPRAWPVCRTLWQMLMKKCCFSISL